MPLHRGCDVSQGGQVDSTGTEAARRWISRSRGCGIHLFAFCVPTDVSAPREYLIIPWLAMFVAYMVLILPEPSRRMSLV